MLKIKYNNNYYKVTDEKSQQGIPCWFFRFTLKVFKQLEDIYIGQDRGRWWNFFQIWLTSDNRLGLSGAKVGTIFSINSILSLILMFIYGVIQDKLFIKRSLLIFNAIIASLIAPFFIYIYAPLLKYNFIVGARVGDLVLSTAYLSAVGILEATTERFSRVFGFAYGQSRAW